MPTIAASGNATGTLGTTDSVTISTRGAARFESPTGTIVAEFSGTRTFGPYSGQTYRVTAVTGNALYEVGDGVTPPTQAQIEALVSGGGIAYATLASTPGTTPGERRTLSDGPDAGAELIWAIPEGSTTYAWCWAIYPLASYL